MGREKHSRHLVDNQDNLTADSEMGKGHRRGHYWEKAHDKATSSVDPGA